ncbi:hypothetical protein MTR67_019760 [Solanum verrucosum]|uniref:Transposase-associated domain-containing protein n=1 Tax=Solanum verrucosum TaxID=315347 RepID=A0AAF0QPT2_SOLVR|nr:hypothetical protein MTR67_019760 [Solanum verrucosum]
MSFFRAMSIDKSWIGKPRNTPEYVDGVRNFLNFAFEYGSIDGHVIKCPCSRCGFNKWHERDVVQEHLTLKPFPENYKFWYLHGENSNATITQTFQSTRAVEETLQPHSPMEFMVNNASRFIENNINVPDVSCEPINGEKILKKEHTERQDEDYAKLFELIEDGKQPLYEGCKKYSKLSFLIRLYHIKCLCRMTDKAMGMILELLKDAFEDAKIPASFYEAKKTINKLGLNYTKIHACPNDCMLYFGKDDEGLQECKKCKTSRWKDKNKKQPAKILRYFPLKPRLQRLYMCSKTAESMRWHFFGGNQDGLMRHPRDSQAWKTFDLLHPEFATDPRNVRLGLASDGFNPFGAMSTTYSIWPVILIPYNRPPWECMKQSSFILSMIIPGKKMPGNDIDVYLQPLIQELRELWYDGVQTFDSSKKETFKMRAALMWTISDFPGLGNLSGWNTYTEFACPTCNFATDSYRLIHSRKWCFMGHRRFLESGHRFRLQRLRFNGKIEQREPPITLSGSDILKQMEGIPVNFRKKPEMNNKRKRAKGKLVKDESRQWRKRSIFFDLPYWESNLLRHNLDVMHIEKNVCENLIYTLLSDSEKSKDNPQARKDLKEMGIRQELWLDENGNYKPSLFTISNTKKNGFKKDEFLRTLKNVKMPDAYASNISRCIDLKQRKIFGMKSHDFHILMEQLLPIAIRKVLPDKVTAVLMELSSFFRQLCAKNLSLSDLDKLQSGYVHTINHLEILFPPTFFTIMVHLTCQLVAEAKLGGPVQFRWMYAIERYLGHLKSFVRNMSQPEACIAEGHVAEDALYFFSQYLEEIETRTNRPRRVNDYPEDRGSTNSSIFPPVGKGVGAETFELSPMVKRQAHRYVVLNCPQVMPFIA